MISMLEDFQNKAINEGYYGLRVTGDMDCFFNEASGTERLMEYEVKLNEFLEDNETTALCQYDKEKFSPSLLINAIHIHPKVIFKGSLNENPYYFPPNYFLARLKGEVTEKEYEDITKDIIQKSELAKEHRRAEKSLRLYERAVEESEDLIAAADKEYRYLFANKSYREYYGQKEGQILGQKIRDLVEKEEFDECIKQNLDKCLEGESVQYEMSRKFPDIDEERHMNVGYYPLRDENGNIRGVVGILRDVTEQTNIRNREDFLHSLLRHDLKNKTHIVKGYHELLLQSEIDDDQREYLKKAEKAIQEGEKLIEKVRTLRRIQEAKVSEVMVDSVIENTISLYESRAAEKDIDIEFERSGCEVRGGPLLEELFSNIIENSILHSSGENIKITSEETENYCIILIKDDGRGIPKEKRDRVFERGFKRGKESGSGLGLYLVKEIAKSYDGDIEVSESEMGGAKFEINLKKSED